MLSCVGAWPAGGAGGHGIGAGAALCLAGFAWAWRWVENRADWNLGEPADTGAEAMLATAMEGPNE